jgi:hypothetical protein
MPRLQDTLFAALAVVIAGLLALHFGVAVPALLGAFLCGGCYLFVGMIPSREEPLWRRAFTSAFLAVVLSSLVLILPGTMGARALRPEVTDVVLVVAVALPLLAIGFEVLRTPRVIRGILRCFGQR